MERNEDGGGSETPLDIGAARTRGHPLHDQPSDSGPAQQTSRLRTRGRRPQRSRQESEEEETQRRSESPTWPQNPYIAPETAIAGRTRLAIRRRQQVVEGLHNYIIKSPETRGNCIICLADYEEGDNITSLQCDHNFHRECIRTWFLEDNPVCPLCRSPLMPR